MDLLRDSEVLVQEDDVRKLVYAFANVYGRTNRDTETVREFAEMQKTCVLLLAKDYMVRVIDDENGSLRSSCPGKIVSLVLPSDGSADETDQRGAHEMHTEMFRDPTEEPHWVRARTRFALPVIIYGSKHICRLATLTGRLEKHWRRIIRFFGESDGYCGQICHSMVAGGAGGGPARGAEAAQEEGGSAANEAGASFQGQLEREDILLLEELSVGQICDLMTEKKQSNRVPLMAALTKWDKFSDFSIVELPYPGCEYFDKYRTEDLDEEPIIPEWDEIFADFLPNLPEDDIAAQLGIQWSDYKKWDLVQRTTNYLQYMLKALFQRTSGILVHCIPGWDRTPLFISLMRLSLWADGEIHKGLSPVEMAYLTVAYDWFLFSHNLPDRVRKSEEIFLFGLHMLKYLHAQKLSILCLDKEKNTSTAETSPATAERDAQGLQGAPMDVTAATGNQQTSFLNGAANEFSRDVDWMSREEFLDRRRERLYKVRSALRGPYRSIMLDDVTETIRDSYWASSLYSETASFFVT